MNFGHIWSFYDWNNVKKNWGSINSTTLLAKSLDCTITVKYVCRTQTLEIDLILTSWIVSTLPNNMTVHKQTPFLGCYFPTSFNSVFGGIFLTSHYKGLKRQHY